MHGDGVPSVFLSHHSHSAHIISARGPARLLSNPSLWTVWAVRAGTVAGGRRAEGGGQAPGATPRPELCRYLAAGLWPPRLA